MNKTQQIKKLSKQGMKPRQIAAQLGTTRQYVYTVRSKLKKRALKPVQIVPLSRWDSFKLALKGLFRGL